MASAFAVAADQPGRRGDARSLREAAVSLIESGFAWLPAFLWRFDKGWRGLRREIPWTRRLPSEYVRDHVRVSLQPVDGPPDPTELARVIDQLGTDEMLMFSTDYPHRHTTEELDAVPAGLPPRGRTSARRQRPRALPAVSVRTKLEVVDCDIHNAPRSEQALLQYMPAQLARGASRRRPAGRRGRGRAARRSATAPTSAASTRARPRAPPATDAWPPTGDPPASDLQFMREQLLDRVRHRATAC